MRYHVEETAELLSLANIDANAYTLDCGAGDGQSCASEMIDLNPKNELVKKADFLALPYENCTFDAVISQCSYYLSGNVPLAIAEAKRVLKPGGKLIYSDVYYSYPDFTGFTIEYEKDLTEDWKKYYIERLWSDEPICTGNFKRESGKVHYGIFILRKD